MALGEVLIFLSLERLFFVVCRMGKGWRDLVISCFPFVACGVWVDM